MKATRTESGAVWVKIFLFALLSILTAAIVILASVPPVSRDALVHHLAVPKLYLKHGIQEIPFMTFSYYPMNLDMLYLVSLRLGNDILPKFIHFSFGLLTAWLVYGYLKKRLNAIYGILGALFFLSIPLIIKLSITVYVDLGLIFFSTGALLLLLRWVNEGFRPRHLILSAVSCGLAMGTKYNGLIVCFLLTLFITFLYSRHGSKGWHGGFKALGYGGLFVALSLIVFSPWMIRNYQWRKNPVYPLYKSFFNPAPSPKTNGQLSGSGGSSRISLFSYREMIYNESWPQIALLPVRVFFEGRDDVPRYFDGRLNPFLLILPLLAFFPRRRSDGISVFDTDKKVLLAFSVLYFCFAFFTRDMRVRYLAPIVPPLIILSVLGLSNLEGILSRLKNGGLKNRLGPVLSGLLAVGLLSYNGAYLLDQFEEVSPLSYLTGALSRDQYISRYRFEYPAMQYINSDVPENAVVFLLFLGNRGYHCDRDYLLGEGRFKRLVEEASDASALYEGLSRIKVTHLAIYAPLFDKWAQDNFSAEQHHLLKRFFSDEAKVLFYQNQVGVYVLGPVHG
jgi:4-amino-4-deoxy-L-arabinose transferase-like glycosyltransferase